MIMASEIHSMNLRYLPADIVLLSREPGDFRHQMRLIRDAFNESLAEAGKQVSVTMSDSDRIAPEQ